MAAHPRAYSLIENEVARLTSHLAQYETIKRFALLPDDFTFEGGALTFTMKLKRRVVEKQFHDLIDKLYSDVIEPRPLRPRLTYLSSPVCLFSRVNSVLKDGVPANAAVPIFLFCASHPQATNLSVRRISMPKAATATARTFPTSVGVPENNRQALIALLNARLADSTDLRTQVKVGPLERQGPAFHSTP